jgi:hypothetical protein
MGKGSRNRKRRGPTASRGSSRPYFHGGVPDKEPGEDLLPAERLGLKFQYLMDQAPYDPRWVYLTSDEAVASAYASRYLDGSGHPAPGDVYEVEPLDSPRVDPDHHVFPDAYSRCTRARIVRVVARGLALTSSEQAKLERRYVVWGSPDKPVWDEDGLVQPSDQMVANGVTREWTSMLRPWLRPYDFDARGRLTIAARSGDFWETVLEAVPSLDRDCQIETLTRPLRRDSYRCIRCSLSPHDRTAAALHQLGVEAVSLLCRIHGWPIPKAVPELIRAARARNGCRWDWLTP